MTSAVTGAVSAVTGEVVAALLAGAAVLVVSAGRLEVRAASGSPRRRGGVPLKVGASACLAGIGVAWLAGSLLAGLVVAASVVLVVRSRRRRAEARRRTQAAARAGEACGVLVEELAAGRAPHEALAAAVEVDAGLSAVVRAAEAGADVPTALRAAGHPAYSVLASAWQVAERHGVGLADACSRVVAHLRSERATDRVVAAELASARATARLLVALPALALVVGTLSGGRPWEFLLHAPLGAVCLVLGLGLGALGLRWIDAIAGDR